MEHTEPPLIAAVPARANPYQRAPAGANDSPSFHVLVVDLARRVKRPRGGSPFGSGW
jgi:hypothetical protein